MQKAFAFAALVGLALIATTAHAYTHPDERTHWNWTAMI